MKYILLIYHDEQAWNALTEAERQDIYLEYRQLIQKLQANAQYLAGDELQTTTTASTVRVRDAKQLVTDGPFAETREQLGGFFMIEAKNLEVVAALLTSGADPNGSTSDGWTPLMAAARTKQCDVVRELLVNGADPNRRDNQGWTALLAAAEVGSEEIASDLIDDKADIEFASDEGWTPLLVAADRGHRRLMALLLEHGAKVETPTPSVVYAEASGPHNAAEPRSATLPPSSR